MSKKLAVVLVSLLCVPGLVLAKDVPFSPQSEISISEGIGRQVTQADVDGDGDLDLVAAMGINDPSGVYWYENLDGEGYYSPARVIDDCSAPASTLCNPFLPEMVDMDGDGDLDAVTGNPNYVGWYDNTDGAGTFAGPQYIWIGNGTNLVDVEVADLDGDGDLDVVAAASVAGTVGWHENLGGGTFGDFNNNQRLLASGVLGVRAVKIADLNGDGAPDVLCASSNDSSISFFANLNGGNFGVRYVISSSTPGAYDVDVADIDGNGRPDVVSVGSSNSADGAVRWYQNVLGDASLWDEFVVFTGSGGFTQHVDVADMDGDGDPDLLTTWFNSTIGGLDRVAWYENVNPISSWTERVVSTDVVRPSDAIVADLDGDGDLDVASASYGPSPAGSSPSDEKLAWYENRTIHRSASYPVVQTVTTEAGPGALNPIAVGDVDRDGDLDVAFGFYDGANRLYLNNGTTDPWNGVVGSDITTDAQPTHEVLFGDFDGDGALDLVSANNGAPSRLYLNNGGADPFNGAIGIDLAGGNSAFSMAAGDIDGDRDLDLVIGACCSVPLRVMLNNGTADPFNGVAPLTYPSFDAKALSLGDLDGDGDLDLVQSGEEGQGTQVRLNNGTTDPFGGVVAMQLGSDVASHQRNAVGDVDGDGDLDVLVGGTQLILYTNNGTTDPFNGVSETFIQTGDGQGTVGLSVSDVDADGDLDLVRTSYFIVPKVYLNNGTADPYQGVAPVNMSFLSTDSRSTAVADINGDGKLDVVTGNTDFNAIPGVKWYPNGGGQFRVTVQGGSGGELYEGEESLLMAITMTLLGRSGDPVGQLESLVLNFRDAVPLTTAQAAALISELRIYRDNGDGTFDAGSDTLLAATPMNLTSGIQTVLLPAGDPNTRIAAPAIFFAVAAMSPTAASAPLTTFRVDYLTDSVVVDTVAGIPLEIEGGPGGKVVPPFVALGRFLVDSANDEDDIVPGDGICQGTSGACTLRAAIEEANLRPGDDLIVVQPALGPYVLSGSLNITDATGGLTIRSDGTGRPVIDGGGVDRVFLIDSGASANLESLTITNGSVASNIAGGGITNIGTLTVDDCQIVSNTGGSGGGLAGVAGSYTLIVNSTIANNTALNSGGGLAVITGSTLELRNSLVADNVATSVAGGIYVLFDGVVNLVNSTVSRNETPPAGSAAIVGDSGAGLGSTIDSLTIFGNTGGGIGWYGPTLGMRNTLVADNGVDIVGPPNIQSLGNNLIGNAGGNGAFDDGVNNDQVGGGQNPPLLPRVSPLGDYGGPTLTHALEAGSPAIDAGICVSYDTDQRGVARPLDVPATANVSDGCDIGSYEALLGQTETRLEVPVRWCGVRGAPSIEDPGLMGAGSVNDLLRARHERAAGAIYIPQGNVSFRSAANFIVEDYPVLEDPDCTETSTGSGVYTCTHGERGDVYVNPEEANFFEFQQLIASCREAWQAQDPTITGITVVHINRFVDGNGAPLELLGLGGRAEPGDIAEQSAAGRVMVVDNFYRQNVAGNPNPPNPEDLVDRLLGHELGHALSLRHGDGIDNDQDGILDNDDEKTQNIPRFDGPNLMQYRSGTELSTEQMNQLRSHIVFAVPDVVVQPTVDALANSTPIDDERARILEFGFGEVVDLERARILEFAEGSPLDFERARILEFERARLLEFERARILEFENARILEFGMTYTGETSGDSAVLVASTGSLPWPAPIRPKTSYYYYLDLDRSDATGGYPANSPNPGDPGNNFPGTDVVQNGGDITQESGVDLIAEIVLDSSCPADVCSSTATLNAYDYNDGTGEYELVFNDPSPTITAKGVGLYIDNGGDPVDLDDAPIGMTLQPRIPNSILFDAGWGFQTDPGTGAQVPNRIRMEVVSTIECDGRVLNDDLNSATVNCHCTDCNVCPDYPGCEVSGGTPVTLTGTRIPTDAKDGELKFTPPVLPQATVSPMMAEEGQTVSVFITELPTDVDGTVEVTLNGALLATAPTSSIAPDGSITVPVNLPFGIYGDLTLSAGITGFAPRADAVVNVTPALACPDNDGDGICDFDDPDDDNDGVADGQDSDSFNPQICADSDNDSCDDCSSGTVNADADGPDYDMDGACDAGDADDDNDGVDDTGELWPFDSMNCSLDADQDGCDDCAVGVDGAGPLPDDDPSNDGADRDMDGICDDGDDCPDDPAKLTPGICGCGVADVDGDGDGTADCDDFCPADPAKVALGICGCGVADTDSDGDGTADCVDACPTDPDPADPDWDGDETCDIADADDDNDGIVDTLDPAPFDPDLCGDADADTCDDCSVGTDDYGPDSDSDTFNDGPDTDADGICDSGTSCPQGADIVIKAKKHTVGAGNKPGSTKEPLVGIEVCAYESSQGSCAQDVCGGTSHHEYTCIATGDGVNGPCDTAMCCTTGADGTCTIDVVPGKYLVISDDATKTVLPDPLGVSAGNLSCGDVTTKHLQQIVKANGKKVPGKTKRITGSELLIIEPEFVIWEETQELYPFIFETIGDWDITATVTPPEGFVADHDELTAEVDNELEVVQFVITEIGSDLVPTDTTFQITHGPRRMVVRGNVDLYLTPEYARSRGFSVSELRRKNLIREKERIGREPRPDIDESRKTASQRAWERSHRQGQDPATGAERPGGRGEERDRGRGRDR